jgi:thioredoxin-like negative regulator of GroEL
LRAAIAGLYIKQGRYREGMQAFREACMLYPASPEATFRYAQECLLPFRRWDVVLELMDYTDRIDPRNKRTAGLRSYVIRYRAISTELERLESKRRENGGKLDDAETFSLARCYSEVGRVREAAQLLHGMVDKPADAVALRFMSTIFLETRLDADAEKVLNRYLRENPTTDAVAWADLAKLQHRTGRKQAAQQSFIQGYRIDAQGLFQRLQKDQELYEIAAPLFKRKQ